MAKISIDKTKCIGCGLCVSIDEASFKMGDGGKAEVLKKEECSGCSCCGDDKVKEAVESCPVQAITLK